MNSLRVANRHHHKGRYECDAWYIGRPGMIARAEISRGAKDGTALGNLYTLGKYGQTFLVTLEMLLADDIDAIGRMVREHILACQRLEDDIVYLTLITNTAMDDSKAFFHGDHNNLLTGRGLTVSWEGENSSSALATSR